jgi:hypothetical protein
MAQRENCPYHIPWSEAPCAKAGDIVGKTRGNCRDLCEGWVLVFVLLFLAVFQGLVLASLSMVTYHLKSSTAFYHIIRNTHFSTQGGQAPTGTQTTFIAPEGWDHLCFSTVLRDVRRGDEQSYSWRVALRQSPMPSPGEVMLSSSRPHLIVIIDDSQTMNVSSGRDYEAESLYLKRVSGEIIHISNVSEVSESISSPEGTLFKGSYGNASLCAPASESSHSSMPSWTLAYSCVISLIDSLELCEVAIMSTSRGMIQQFTHNRHALAMAMEGIHPTSTEARLAETLYQATQMFPEQCATDRHIILVTCGVAINDGHLPEWLKDYDHDSNLNDTTIKDRGCHCLDDVSAYAFSHGIRVHTIGPDTTFLRSTATKGGGSYMPDRDVLAPQIPFVCQPMVILEGREYIPLHTMARFYPPWIRTGSETSLRTGIIDPYALIPCPNISIKGLAITLTPQETSMFCTTSRDQFLKVSLPLGDLNWLITGIGGHVLKGGDRIIAGPNSKGDVFCLDGQPSILWTEKGERVDTSGSEVYISSGSSITAHHLDNGTCSAGFNVNHTITALTYDVCTGILLAGTEDGLLYLLSKELEPQSIIMTGISDAVIDIKPFSWRKKSYFIAMSPRAATCCTTEGSLWSFSFVKGSPVSCIIMNRKAYVCTWQEADPCGGIDTGTSTLVIVDVLTGEHLDEKTLFPGKAFGPTIDLEAKRIVYVSWNGQVYQQDISGLEGITWCTAGRRILRKSG